MSHPGLAPPDAIDVPSGVYVGLDLDTPFLLRTRSVNGLNHASTRLALAPRSVDTASGRSRWTRCFNGRDRTRETQYSVEPENIIRLMRVC